MSGQWRSSSNGNSKSSSHEQQSKPGQLPMERDCIAMTAVQKVQRQSAAAEVTMTSVHWQSSSNDYTMTLLHERHGKLAGCP